MKAKNLIGGLLAGVAIGIAIGMLLVPSSGKKLVKESKDLAHKVKKGVKDYSSSLQDKYTGVTNVAQKAKEVMNDHNEGDKV